MNEFYEGMAEILEIDVEDLGPTVELSEDKWDSLAIVSTIALIDEVYDIAINADGLGNCETVGDIDALVAEQRKLAD